ncbi:hypothetical protein ACFX2B_025101 [Malus domestica]
MSSSEAPPSMTRLPLRFLSTPICERILILNSTNVPMLLPCRLLRGLWTRYMRCCCTPIRLLMGFERDRSPCCRPIFFNHQLVLALLSTEAPHSDGDLSAIAFLQTAISRSHIFYSWSTPTSVQT